MSFSEATEKNHEQYLEEIEIAVAETTKALMEEHNTDLRKLAKVCAEKQVEIERLKEYQTNDRKTIRNLRGMLKEATEEIVSYKEELDIAHFEYERLKKETWNKTQVDEIVRNAIDSIEQDCDALNQENNRLKVKLESYKEYPQQGGWEKALENIKGIKDVVIKENHKLAEKVAELEERLDGAWSNYSTEADRVDELKEENKKLTEKFDELFTEINKLTDYERKGIYDIIELVEELKENKEDLEATIEMMRDGIKECKSGTDGGVYGLVAEEEYEKLKAENKELKEQLKKV